MNRTPINILSIITATYQYVWAERFYLVQLGIAPFIIAWINTILVGVIEEDLSFLRRGLLMLPSILVEAWLVSQFLRTVLTNEKWPQSLPRNIPRPVPPAILLRVRGLLGAIVIYILTALIINAAVGSFITTYPDIIPKSNITEPHTPSDGMGIAMVMIAISMIQFRLFFMHIPMVVNIPFRTYLSITHGAIVNIQMIAVWIAVQIPVLILTLMIIPPLAIASMGTDPTSYIAFLVTSALSVLSQMCMSILGSTVISYLLFPTLIQHRAR